MERCGEQFLEDPHGEIIVKPNEQAMQCLWLITSGSSHSLLVTVDELSIGNTGMFITLFCVRLCIFTGSPALDSVQHVY